MQAELKADLFVIQNSKKKLLKFAGKILEVFEKPDFKRFFFFKYKDKELRIPKKLAKMIK